MVEWNPHGLGLKISRIKRLVTLLIGPIVLMVNDSIFFVILCDVLLSTYPEYINSLSIIHESKVKKNDQNLNQVRNLQDLIIRSSLFPGKESNSFEVIKNNYIYFIHNS